ncbi:hypothetical protein CC80DRAFT_487990 [Byssothecium circinans]|uniref:Uncharacterized protein n=1 Tax=Byssothecium circinans TaxID=147558 RepID=A0A6A5UI27_9PLEO|nr:hypothetical protein CC80DRAFT_487990 [Byssothecium circinans]
MFQNASRGKIKVRTAIPGKEYTNTVFLVSLPFPHSSLNSRSTDETQPVQLNTRSPHTVSSPTPPPTSNSNTLTKIKMAVITISDYHAPQALTSSPPHPWSRQCPNYRTCWPGLSATYNPLTSSRPLMLRRISFLLIQLAQLILFFFYEHRLPASLKPSALPWTLAGMLFFAFTAWNLHLVVDMEGTKVVFGRRYSRTAFDAFLWGTVVAYVGLLGYTFAVRWGYEVQTADLLLHLAILGVAWVSTWGSEGGVTLGNDAV